MLTTSTLPRIYVVYLMAVLIILQKKKKRNRILICCNHLNENNNSKRIIISHAVSIERCYYFMTVEIESRFYPNQRARTERGKVKEAHTHKNNKKNCKQSGLFKHSSLLLLLFILYIQIHRILRIRFRFGIRMFLLVNISNFAK